MSPHAAIFLAALSIGFVAKAAFPGSTLRVIAASALAFPLALSLYFREPVSLLGFLIIAPIAILGAAIGTAAGAGLVRARR